MPHVVTAPLVIAKNADGSDAYIYDGGLIPDEGPTDEWIDQMVGEGLVAEVDESGGGDEPPAGNAGLGAWQDYARSHGYSEDEVAGKTRAELRALFE